MKASSFDVLRQMTSNEEIAAKGEQSSEPARCSLELTNFTYLGLDTFSSHDNTA